ncbi:PHD finger protein 20 isoform X2 [Engraulis encrasicolus]|uniref:PHD finger protein 20 isoform X2 n=1 Tax=Engraulis encrasicolus TaxID=184585 RepID=UPI002FD6690B
MNKSPPNRRGITFEVGAQLEARDSLKNWYAASIERIDYDDEKVLIHYRQWSHRYDEWFDWASPYLRPVERIQLRREGLQQDEGPPTPGFRVNDKVLASWSDCRFYPATVLAVNKDASYTVRFYDNVVQTVKSIHIKPYAQLGRHRGGKPQATTERKRAASGDGKNPRGRERKPAENRVPLKGKRNRPGSSDQDGDSHTDEDGDQEGHPVRWNHEGRDKERDTAPELPPVGLRDGERKPEDGAPAPHGNGGVKAKEGTEQEVAGRNGATAEGLGHGGEVPGDGVAAAWREQRDEELAKKMREQGPPESWAGKEDCNSSVLKKRRLSVEQASLTKKSKADGHTESCLQNGTASHTEASNQNEPAASASTAPALAQPSNSTPVQAAQGQSDTGTPTVTPPVKPVRKQGFHNPNRFSREPLYRVVKNQPPPVLSINLDHNAFKCSAPGCTKSFRKAKLLHYHMKYYHGDTKPLEEGDLSPTTPTPTPTTAGGGPKQAGAPNTNVRDSPKRRRTISASMHSSQLSPSRTPTSPRCEAKTGLLLGEKRRTSAPPAVDIQLQHQHQQQHQQHQHQHQHQHHHHQRPLLKDKSKENQLERNAHTNTDRDRSPIDIAAVCLKEREKTKEKKNKDFLRIKLKKKKKKKKSKSDYRGSEENIDFSLFQHQSSTKLGLPPLKLPPSLSHHKPEAYSRRPGHFHHTQQSRVEDEDYGTDWSTDSCGWSDEEAEEESVLDSYLSDDDSMATETGDGSEIVRCVCEVEEDNDFMIQCEECLCWQHGTCMGLLEDNVPDRYTCYICRDPPGQRQSLRYWCDREWLSSGHMYGLSFLKENYSHQNARKITATHQLLGDVQQVLEVLNGLQLKIGVLQDQSHPDLQLWCEPWQSTSSSSIKKEEDASFPVAGGGTHATSPDENTPSTNASSTAIISTGGGGAASGQGSGQRRAPSSSTSSLSSHVSSSSSSSSSLSPLSSSFQDAFLSYISSEHCYQKPRALVVEKRSSSGASYMDNGDLHGYDTQGGRHYARQQRPDKECWRWGDGSDVKVKLEEEDDGYPGGGGGHRGGIGGGGGCSSAQQQQWQTNLLDHIETVQDEVVHRMDFIEKELDVLESCLDYTGELEPPEPLSRLPQLKHRIKELLSELGKVQQIALTCSA